jgi:hypothetical protein
MPHCATMGLPLLDPDHAQFTGCWHKSGALLRQDAPIASGFQDGNPGTLTVLSALLRNDGGVAGIVAISLRRSAQLQSIPPTSTPGSRGEAGYIYNRINVVEMEETGRSRPRGRHRAQCQPQSLWAHAADPEGPWRPNGVKCRHRPGTRPAARRQGRFQAVSPKSSLS